MLQLGSCRDSQFINWHCHILPLSKCLTQNSILPPPPSQVAKMIEVLLGQYTIATLGRYSKMALGQFSFLENLVDIENWYRPNNNTVIYPISPKYCINIGLILSCPLKEHWLITQFLILKSQYWLDTQKYHWANMHFWKIMLILEKYIAPIIVLSFSQLQLKRSCFSYIFFDNSDSK